MQNLTKKFWRYVFASMITTFLQSAYSIVDSLFVSNFVSATAMASINVCWPVIAVVTAIGTGIGCGGSVIMSTQQGAGRQRESNIVRSNILVLLLAAGILCTLVMLPLLRPLLMLMGAEGDLLTDAVTYGRIMLAGGVMQVLSCGMTPLLRNDNRAVSAMSITIGGLCVNLTCDFVSMRVLRAGVAGAAAASVLAQTFTVVGCALVLLTEKDNPLKKDDFRILPMYWRKILANMLSPFGISLVPSLLILYHNVACMHSPEALAVSAYALISSTIGSYRVLLIGVADGIQPLASYTNGAGDMKGLRKIRNLSIATAVSVSVLLFVFTMATASYYPSLFGYTGEEADLALHAVRVSAAQLIFTGLTRVTNSFFYAIGKTRYSLFMIYFDPLCMTPLMLLVLPKLLGTDGIWLTAVFTQLILDLVAVWMFCRNEKEIQRREMRQKVSIAKSPVQEGAM